jgi:hypothetical protein
MAMSEEGKASLLDRFNGAGIRPRRLCTWGRKPGAVSGKRRRAAVFSLATARGLSSAWRTHGRRGDWPMGLARWAWPDFVEVGRTVLGAGLLTLFQLFQGLSNYQTNSHL